MNVKLPGPHSRGARGQQGAETGSPELKTLQNADRASRAIDADRTGAGLALANSATHRATAAAGIRHQEMLVHRSAVLTTPSRRVRSCDSATALDKFTGVGSDRSSATPTCSSRKP